MKTCEDFEDYNTMSVVNSPRRGVRAYECCVVDKERGGIFMKKKQL